MVKNKRLFFALWPDEDVRSCLANLQTLLPQEQGVWVHPHDLHVTLRFLGSVPANQQRCINQAAGAVQAYPFELEIAHLGFWPKPGIAWASPEQAPMALMQLVKALAENLRECGVQAEKRPYRPHITLLRKTTPGAAVELPESISWQVDHFVLVESRPGGEPPWYRVLDGWDFS